jgi:hypothetical protein
MSRSHAAFGPLQATTKLKVAMQQQPRQILISCSRKLPSFNSWSFLPRESTTGGRLPSAIVFLILLLCSAVSTCAQGEAWTTVDDIEGGDEHCAAVDRAGNVFVAGSLSEGGVGYGFVTKTTDFGATWENIVEHQLGGISGIATATVEVQPGTFENHLIIAINYNGQWVTKRSLDAGITWETVDVFTHSTSSNNVRPNVWSAAIDNSGNIYVVGHAMRKTVVKNKTSSAYYWLVRKIAKDAPSSGEFGKFTFDLFDTANGGNSWPHGVVCVGSDVFIAGTSGDRWQVRKGSGSGAQWSLVDDFRYDPNYPSQANAIAADSSGNLYVVGTGRRAVGRAAIGYWIVRKGNSATADSFQTIDRFELESNRHSAANGVCVDSRGDVHVTGFASVTVGTYQPGRWITRQLSEVTQQWATTDHFYLTEAGGSAGRDTVAAPGNIFAFGGASGHEWISRRAPVTP